MELLPLEGLKSGKPLLVNSLDATPLGLVAQSCRRIRRKFSVAFGEPHGAFKLQKMGRLGTLEGVKRWQTVALVAAGLAVVGYVYYTRSGATLPFGLASSPSQSDQTTDAPGAATVRPAHMDWRTVNRPDDGFKIELPAEAKELQVPAYNEAGSSEPVKMIFANPDNDTTFAISWEDNPPVARVNGGSPEKTLGMARDGMLSRTRTMLVSESHTMASGFPARDIAAKNSDGGILDARLIFTGTRLYTLMALYPSAANRREQDVIRFFKSFAPSRQPGTSLPEATMP